MADAVDAGNAQLVQTVGAVDDKGSAAAHLVEYLRHCLRQVWIIDANDLIGRVGGIRERAENVEDRARRQFTPRADGVPAEGTITIRPVGQRLIRYELSFVGSDGKPYEMLGQKDIRWTAPLETFTNLPAEILDDLGQRVATCTTRFDLANDLGGFLRSFRRI